jgi:prepilin-type N-terminal cleavage/methylation domain-containing protein
MVQTQPVMATRADGWPRSEGGYSLLELVTVVAIVAIAAALAYPALAGLRRGPDLESAAVGLTQKLRLAQWRAAATGGRMRVASRRTPDGLWRFRVEREDRVAWLPDGEEQSMPRGTVVAIAGDAEKVFNPDGTSSFGSITLRGPGGEVYRCTLAPATGRARLYRGEREAGRGL